MLCFWEYLRLQHSFMIKSEVWKKLINVPQFLCIRHYIQLFQNHLCSSIMDKRIRISQRRLCVFCALYIIRKNEILNTFQESRCVYCCSKGQEQCLFLMAAWLQHYRLHKACSLNCIKTNRVMVCSQEFRTQLICLSLLTLKYILLGGERKWFACYFGNENLKSL